MTTVKNTVAGIVLAMLAGGLLMLTKPYTPMDGVILGVRG